MSDNVYEFKKQGDFQYAFTSEGPKGSVKKVVTFEEVFTGVYNVLLQDEIGGVLSDDMVITGNHDALKVVNTIAAIIRNILGKPPVLAVYIAGSTEQRSGMYQRKILRELGDLQVLGRRTRDSEFEPVEKNQSYHAFLVLPK
jgi:hypothetical protein